LTKGWKVRESQLLKFAREVFKVTNSVRFDVNPNNNFNNVSTGGSLEVYGATLTAPWVQQFSLRYSF
jgi:hypothetical protein